MARRSKAEIDAIRAAIYDYCERHYPLTVRQLFYALVCAGLIDKTEGEYKQTVVRLTGEMRLSCALPWHWLVDNTRWVQRPVSFASLADCVERSAQTDRRSLWKEITH
ncbi:hypothetical protein [Cyanobium sp. Copco_Reservoir_LC18]|uniref:hypothetical protein n=1 Tax=Cyanobium sp. Copco_Reservoir_LC18 TaxID=1328305 RepID=UPI001F399FAD|nr:hypothetical protein [Cyanobium sp. Copco_Reservoir_LC18]